MRNEYDVANQEYAANLMTYVSQVEELEGDSKENSWSQTFAEGVNDDSFTLSGIAEGHEPLSIDEVNDTIEFIILEKTENDVTVVEKETLATTDVTISSDPGLNIITRILSARLTTDGANAALIAAASDSYSSNIIVALSTE